MKTRKTPLGKTFPTAGELRVFRQTLPTVKIKKLFYIK